MRFDLKSAGRICPAFLLSNWDIHPSIRIILFVAFSVLVSHLELKTLILFCLIFVLVLNGLQEHQFFNVLKRMRWLFMSMMIIYAYATPGQYFSSWPMEFAPTYEGCLEGIKQISRISLVLAGIAILKATSTGEVLMLGMYCLLRPFKIFNLAPERFTARLYLTLQYINQTHTDSRSAQETASWYQLLNEKLNHDKSPFTNQVIEFDMPRLRLLDCLCIVMCLIFIGFSL